MEHGSMACCSRGQLVKHRYTNRLMSLYSSFSLLRRHVLAWRSVSVFVELPTGVVWIRRRMLLLYRRWDAGFLVVRCHGRCPWRSCSGQHLQLSYVTRLVYSKCVSSMHACCLRETQCDGGSCIDACRCCAGKYSPVTGATACVDCGEGERDASCSRVIWCPLTLPSLCVYGGGGCSTRIYVDSGKYRGLVRSPGARV
jgi:hypothetical protein